MRLRSPTNGPREFIINSSRGHVYWVDLAIQQYNIQIGEIFIEEDTMRRYVYTGQTPSLVELPPQPAVPATFMAEPLDLVDTIMCQDGHYKVIGKKVRKKVGGYWYDIATDSDSNEILTKCNYDELRDTLKGLNYPTVDKWIDGVNKTKMRKKIEDAPFVKFEDIEFEQEKRHREYRNQMYNSYIHDNKALDKLLQH